jgi:hypothetical protein
MLSVKYESEASELIMSEAAKSLNFRMVIGDPIHEVRFTSYLLKNIYPNCLTSEKK